MASQAESAGSLPTKLIPAEKHTLSTAKAGDLIIHHQRQAEGAQLSLLQGGSYTPIADTWVDKKKNKFKARMTVVNNVDRLWIDS